MHLEAYRYANKLLDSKRVTLACPRQSSELRCYGEAQPYAYILVISTMLGSDGGHKQLTELPLTP